MPSIPPDSVLALPAFRRYFAARTISLLGDAMLPVALTAAVVRQGYGAGGVGLVLAAPLVPWVLLMLFTGVLADRIGPLPLMIGADALRLVAQLVLALAFLLDSASLALIVTIQVISGIGTALFQPGVGSVITAFTDRVQEANGWLRSAEATVGMLGPAAAGLALVVADPAVVVAINATTFAASGVLLLLLRLPSKLRTASGKRLIPDLVEGWHEFISRRWLWSVILMFGLFGVTVFGPFFVLSSTRITQHHGSGVYGAVLAVQGLGSVLGGAIGARIRPRKPLFVAVCALILIVPQFLALAADATVLVIAASMGIGALGRSVWTVLWTSTEQLHIPAAALNRVYAYDVVGSVALLPLGRALAGPMTAVSGTDNALLACAAVAVAGCAVLLAVPEIRRLPERPAASDPQAIASEVG
ncbi:MFS transporter [Streptomyces prunicolor]|uniref:MFS transporter n=1 Tax=Streptomyces prunicolor TaxID=67348 RepID=UPI003419AA34